MKYSVVFLLYFLLLGCSPSEDRNTLPEGLPQLWKLTSMNLGLSGEVLTGDEVPYSQTIALSADSTFTKTRLQDDETLLAKGTFSYTERDGEQYIVFLNSENNDLIGNCNRSLEEWFLFTSETVFYGGGLACDRPGLGYERTE